MALKRANAKISCEFQHVQSIKTFKCMLASCLHSEMESKAVSQADDQAIIGSNVTAAKVRLK